MIRHDRNVGARPTSMEHVRRRMDRSVCPLEYGSHTWRLPSDYVERRRLVEVKCVLDGFTITRVLVDWVDRQTVPYSPSDVSSALEGSQA